MKFKLGYTILRYTTH